MAKNIYITGLEAQSGKRSNARFMHHLSPLAENVACSADSAWKNRNTTRHQSYDEPL
jgi:hypothetical protein